jgi:hypothetical protein
MTKPKETSYEVLLDTEIRLRIGFTRDRNEIKGFVVQLEYFVDEQWYPVIRYDTTHQFAHCDILRPDGSQEKQPMPIRNYNEALTYAQKDIMVNFRRYCARFKEWLS